MKRNFFVFAVALMVYSLNCQTDVLTVTTESISDLNGTMVIADGHIDIPERVNVVQHGFCWSVSDDPSVYDNHIELGSISISGKFTSTVTELECSTEYNLRSYAYTPQDTVYGNIKQFKTLEYISEKPAGSGTEEDPYVIRKLDHLYWMSLSPSEWDRCYRQVKDIDAFPTAEWYDGQGWIPVGNSVTMFNGKYNGEGHVIKNLYIERIYSSGLYTSLQENIGFFGRTYNADVSNLGIVDIKVYGDHRTGGLIGYGKGTRVRDCYVSGSINISDDIGVLIGLCESSTIDRCFSSGDASGMGLAGGLIGRALHSTITNSYSTARAAGQAMAGGMAGVSLDCDYADCYCTGLVYARAARGAFIGSDDYDGDNSFTACFCSDALPPIGTGSNTAEGLSGLEGQLLLQKDTFLNAGWDFVKESVNGTEDIWGIDVDINSGYPYLACIQMLTDIEGTEELIPEVIGLKQNYPNPFNPATTITFSIPYTQNVKLSVYSSNGQLVEELINNRLSNGNHSVQFNGDRLNSGIYFYALETGASRITRKMLLIK